MSPASAPITRAPPILWAAARALLATIFALFGEPARIAAQHTHRQSERRLLLKWLRAGEALMRHLLLIEAAHYAKPDTQPAATERSEGGPQLRAPRKRTRRLMTFEPDKPEAWCVSFRCFATSDRRLPAGKPFQTPSGVQQETPRRLEAGGPQRRRFYSARPLAERAEAMLRAFNNPEPYARRLAARLHAAPNRAASLTRHSENLPHVIDDFVTLRDQALAARRRFESG